MRVYNFSAGPAVLPEEVLKEAADEMLDYKGTGMSVMEMSHRSKAYDAIIKEAQLQGSVLTGRCVTAVRRSSHEPYEERQGCLHNHRPVG